MAWEQVVQLTGDPGPQGPTGPQGPQGETGPQGPAGEGIAIAGMVAAYGDLPTGLGPGDAGDGYLVEADGLLYPWSGTAFPADGFGVAFQGPAGPTGPEGPTGPTGAQGIQGIQGIQGATGSTGAAGADGADGADGLRGTQMYGDVGTPTAVTGSAVGDWYIDTTPGAVVLYRLEA